MKRIYLDHAAATPVSSVALHAQNNTAKRFPGNPSAIHQEGRHARVVLEEARASVAKSMSARPDEIVFTSSATESNNMAIIGVVRAAQANGIEYPRVIVSSIEHPSVLSVLRYLEKEGVLVDYLPVDSCGIVGTKDIRKLITRDTVLISIMYANNEIGIIEPVINIAKEVRHARKINKSTYPYFHTDAAQAGNYLDINVLRLGVDLMTLSSGKTYGPRGVSALFIKRGILIQPLMYGGEQEGKHRPGTEPVALAAGFAVALQEAQKMRQKESARVKKLRDILAVKISDKILGVSVNGNLEKSLPNILNLSIEGVESEALVLYLDAVGIAVSGKSACKSSDVEQSHVIMALDKQKEEISGSVRFSLGRGTKNTDVTFVVKELSRIVPLLRLAYQQSDSV